MNIISKKVADYAPRIYFSDNALVVDENIYILIEKYVSKLGWDEICKKTEREDIYFIALGFLSYKNLSVPNYYCEDKFKNDLIEYFDSIFHKIKNK